MTERCALTELPVDGCAHCRGDRTRPLAPDTLFDDQHPEVLTWDEIGPSFAAQWPGRCAVCDRRFLEGATIAALEDGSGYACSRHLA